MCLTKGKKNHNGYFSSAPLILKLAWFRCSSGFDSLIRLLVSCSYRFGVVLLNGVSCKFEFPNRLEEVIKLNVGLTEVIA